MRSHIVSSSLFLRPLHWLGGEFGAAEKPLSSKILQRRVAFHYMDRPCLRLSVVPWRKEEASPLAPEAEFVFNGQKATDYLLWYSLPSKTQVPFPPQIDIYVSFSTGRWHDQSKLQEE